MAKALMNIKENNIEWREGVVPVSSQYDDVYFSVDNGLAETQYVFIEGNEVPQRLSRLSYFEPFVIAETGFGTGLNFLATWCLFEHSQSRGILEYISVEKYPLKKQDLAQALANFPELDSFSEKLLQIWQHLYSGVHRIKMAPRVYLTLHIGDVKETFLNTHYIVDAWYLDGFAPSKNPDMWTSELFYGMAVRSTIKTTFSTFTAAGVVKRGLKQAGFKVCKSKGFGRKRDMLVGCFGNENQTFHVKPQWYYRPQIDPPKRVLVVGAGLAGGSAASMLADYGCEVTIIDKENNVANQASGNPYGLSKPPIKLGVDTPLYEFGEAGFLHGLNQKSKQESVHSHGVVSLWSKNLDNDKAKDFFTRRVFEDDYLVRAPKGVTSTVGAVIEPKMYVENLLQNENISLELGVDLKEIDCSVYDAVILATGAQLIKHFSDIRPVRGQISYLPPMQNRDCSAYSYGGYAVCSNDLTLVGATFDHNDNDGNLRDEDHYRNLADFNQALGCSVEMGDIIDGRVSWRATTPDHLPIVGPTYSDLEFFDQYSTQLKGGKAALHHEKSLTPEVYLIGGLGSHGLNYASLAADIVLHYLMGSPAPVSDRLLKSVHPMRFLARKIQKNQVSRETLKGEDK